MYHKLTERLLFRPYSLFGHQMSKAPSSMMDTFWIYVVWYSNCFPWVASDEMWLGDWGTGVLILLEFKPARVAVNWLVDWTMQV